MHEISICSEISTCGKKKDPRRTKLVNASSRIWTIRYMSELKGELMGDMMLKLVGLLITRACVE